MMKWLFLIILFVIAIVFGVEIVKDPGYALFVYHGWSIQMPLWFAFLLLLLLLFCVHVITRVFYGVVFLKYSIKFWWMKRALHQKEMQNQKKEP